MKEKIARFYAMRLYTKAQVARFVQKGALTAADYEEITGEPFEG